MMPIIMPSEKERSLPVVSVIIPALNEAENIERCLLSVINQEYPTSRYEIIVVDNGSLDSTVEIGRACGAAVYVLPQVSVAALRNHGAKKAKGDVLAFIDADCEAGEGWILKAVETLKKCGLTGNGCLASSKGSIIEKAWGLHYLNQTGNERLILGGNMIVQRAVFDAIGGFDESLRSGEDYDICLRVIKSGGAVTRNEMLQVTHHGYCQTLFSFFLKELWHGKELMKLFLGQRVYLKSKVLIFAIYDVCVMLVLVAGILFADPFIVAGSLISLLMVPFALSIRVTFRQRKPAYFLSLVGLYLVYGLARAICLINPKNFARR